MFVTMKEPFQSETNETTESYSVVDEATGDVAHHLSTHREVVDALVAVFNSGDVASVHYPCLLDDFVLDLDADGVPQWLRWEVLEDTARGAFPAEAEKMARKCDEE